jgi:hypothetical protein
VLMLPISWTAAVVTIAVEEAKIHFVWTEHDLKDEGAKKVKKGLKDWILGNREESKNTWEDRLKKEMKALKYREPFLEPTVTSAEAAIKKRLLGPPDQTGTYWTEVKNGRLLLLSGKSASSELVSAIKSATILPFLEEMASPTGQIGKVTSAEFTAEIDPGPNSWYYRQPGGGLENKAYVKSRFRSESAARKGKHEWIPCDLIADAVDHAKSPEGATTGLKWIRLHDKLRSPTDDVIFRPPATTLKTTIADLMNGKDFDAQRDAVLQHDLSVETLNVSGHVGALYLEYDNARHAVVTGTDAFHNRL